jgi:hypothetical protein
MPLRPLSLPFVSIGLFLSFPLGSKRLVSFVFRSVMSIALQTCDCPICMYIEYEDFVLEEEKKNINYPIPAKLCDCSDRIHT